MSFLAPLFLLGGLAVALPIVFHLIRRTTRERAVFSSLLFLQPTPPRLSRRSRLEHWLLLVLRCVVLGLLAVGFARPFFKKPLAAVAPAATGRRVVVLVDDSASMRRANLWRDACAQAESALRATTPADEVALLTFDRELQPLVSFEQWNATAAGDRVGLVLGKLGTVSPGWSSTHLGHALTAAAELLAEPHGQGVTRSGEILLITDLQEGSRLDGLQGYEWPKNVKVNLLTVRPRRHGNASLQWVTEADEGPRKADGLRVRVSNSSDSTGEQFQVGWAQLNGKLFAAAPVQAYVPPGQSRVVSVPLLGGGSGSGPGTNRAVLGSSAVAGQPSARDVGSGSVLLLQGDAEDFDNTLYVLPPETSRSQVIYFGKDSEQDTKHPLYFLRRAFQETQRQVIQVVARSPEASVPAAEIQASALLVIADPLAAENVNRVRAAMVAGKTGLVFLRNTAAAANVAALLGMEQLAASEARPSQYAMLAEIDFHHPLFAPFADPRFSDFTKIHFWQYRRLETSSIAGARVLARFDSGDPALLEVPVGKGRLLVLTSGWHPDDSQLALSTKFVPLLYSLLEECGGAAPAFSGYRVGDVVPLAGVDAASSSAGNLRFPDGSERSLPPGTTNFAATVMPGVYTARTATTVRRFAVNLDPAESRTAPLPADELERLGVPMGRPMGEAARQFERKTRWQNAELEDRQKLWRWCILATLALALLETWLAGRTLRRSVVQVAKTGEAV